MPRYVDGFVLPIRKTLVPSYRRIAGKAARIWREHGALEYRECLAEDVDARGMVPFPALARIRPGETVVFAWAVFRSRKHRDRANVTIMNDPRLAALMAQVPFDYRRMAYGGFTSIAAG